MMKRKRLKLEQRAMDVADHGRAKRKLTMRDIMEQQRCSYRYAWRIVRHAQNQGYVDVWSQLDPDFQRRTYISTTTHFIELYHSDIRFARSVQHAVDNVDHVITYNVRMAWRARHESEGAS